jgi:hypothetical protein
VLAKDKQIVESVYQLEMAPDTGKLHWQMFIRYSAVVRFHQVQNLLPGCHQEGAVCPVRARAYCSKESSRILGPYSYGTLPKPGKREDLDEIRTKIQNGVDSATLAEEHWSDWIRYNRSFELYRQLIAKPPDRTHIHTLLFYGKSGSGKSHSAQQLYPQAYWKASGIWWDGYQGQDTIILDEFRGNFCPLQDLLRWLDPYPCRIQVKGGSMWANWHTVVITTNVLPSCWYDYNKPGLEYGTDAIKRRIKSWNLFSEFQRKEFFECFEFHRAVIEL